MRLWAERRRNFSSSKYLARTSLAFVLVAANCAIAQIVYTFRDGEEGGVAYLRIDPKTGKLLEHQTLIRKGKAKKADKPRFSLDGRHVAITISRKKTPNMLIKSVFDNEKPRNVSLPGKPDEIRAAQDGFVVSCDNGMITFVPYLAATRGQATFDANALDPPASDGEDVLVPDNLPLAIVSMEKDNRILILDLTNMSLRADIRLPAELNGIAASDDMKSKGPQPEVILASSKANTLFVTLDAYGGIGLMDLDAAVNGQTTNLVYLSTALDGSWGTAYPDRASLLTLGAKKYALVTNAGRAGGLCLVDLAGRKVSRRFRVRHGLEKPAVLPGANVVVLAPAGKLKGEGPKSYHPGNEVILLNLDGADTPADIDIVSVPLDKNIFYVVPIDAESSSLVLLAAGADKPDRLLVFDVLKREVVTRAPANGKINRMEAFR
jgi:hypothetical protein